MIWSYVSLAIAVAIGVMAQISLKEGVTRSPSSESIGSLILDPYVVAGLGAYAVAALFYIHAIRQVPLSVAFPSVSVSYVAVALLAHWIWEEPFGRAQIVALVLISSGIYVLGHETRVSG